MNAWTSDVEIDDAVARRVIGQRFPELQMDSLKHIGTGWDNSAFLVNEQFVFRLPRRKTGGELMLIEYRSLRHLNQFPLPLSIPNPCFFSDTEDDFPYAVAGYPIIPGWTAEAVEWSVEERTICAHQLGNFLSELHKVPTEVPFAVTDNMRRADLTYRLPKILAESNFAPEPFRELARTIAQMPLWDRPLVWLHGDLYSRHVVVNDQKSVIGLIDFGDTHLGDPALDIAIAWMFLPKEGRRIFREIYGDIDEATWQRARFRTMNHIVILHAYAQDKSDDLLMNEVEFMLANVLSEPL
jgi:aminoglycoside phosphotransferase (APT) family kinase protein